MKTSPPSLPSSPATIAVAAAWGDKTVKTNLPLSELPRLLADPDCFLWVDLFGPPSDVLRQVVKDIFQFHPLAVEDCFESREVPKVEIFDGYLYLITHGLSAGSTAEGVEIVELDAFLGRRYVVTYHEKFSRSVAAVTALAERGGTGLLNRGPASLLHALLDRQVDGIEPVLESIEERLEKLEDHVFLRPKDAELATLLAMRRTTSQLRRWMSKQREAMLRLSRNDNGFVTAAEAMLFRDIYDHLARFTDLVDSFREMTRSIQDAYLSVTNNRLSEVMKFLTVYTAILMPMTVITGIYGMNFQYMPELGWKHGYLMVLGIMAATGLGVTWFFRRRGWLGGTRDRVL